MPCTSRRASRTVQRRGPSSTRSRERCSSAVTKFQSKRALWATKMRPESAASTWSASSPNAGAWRTISLVMLVMAQIAGGIGRPGLISVSSTTSRRPPWTTTTAISVIRSLPIGAHPRGLDVHHREAALVQQRRALRLRHQSPPSIGELPHPGIGAEQRDRHPLAHQVRRARQSDHLVTQGGGQLGSLTEPLVDPIDQRAGWMGLRADHSGRRRSGRVMQRGPPPPRASSLPSTVMTVRCLASLQSSKARKFTAGTTRKPAASSSHRVASLRR